MKKRNLFILIAVILVIAIIITLMNISKAIGESQPPTNQLPTTERHAGSTGQCQDGAYTYADHHSGACSSHGGIKVWFN